MYNKFDIVKNIEIGVVDEKQILTLMNFQKQIIDNMPNKEWFTPLTEEEFLTAINGKDNVYFLFYKNEIIGLLVLTCDIPDVLVKYKIPNNNYMLIDCIMVKDEYRGYGLQNRMLNFAYDRAKKLKMNGLVATVHPDNKYSLNNFVADNYKLLHTLIIHNGIRNEMIKNINN